MTAPRPLTALVLCVALVAGLGACGGDDDEGTKVTTETTGSGQKIDGTSVSLKAALSGKEEVPGPGVDPGIGAITFDVAGTRGCYDLKVTMGEKPLKAHIHQGAKGVSGPVVVDLKPTFEPGESAFTAASCVDLTPELAGQLVADPAGYYVNVHSAAHPEGAMRGQLAKL